MSDEVEAGGDSSPIRPAVCVLCTEPLPVGDEPAVSDRAIDYAHPPEWLLCPRCIEDERIDDQFFSSLGESLGGLHRRPRGTGRAAQGGGGG